MLTKTDRDYLTYCISNALEIVCLVVLLFVVVFRTTSKDETPRIKREILAEVSPIVENVSSNMVKLSSAVQSIAVLVTNDFRSVALAPSVPSSVPVDSGTNRFSRLAFGRCGDSVCLEGMYFDLGDLTPYGVLNYFNDNFLVCDNRVYFRSAPSVSLALASIGGVADD